MDLSPPFHREHATMSTGPPLTPPMSPKTYRTEWDEAACRREIEADEAEKAHLELSILKIGTAKAFGEDPDIVWTKRSSESQQATQNLSPTRHLGALSADEGESEVQMPRFTPTFSVLAQTHGMWHVLLIQNRILCVPIHRDSSFQFP